MKGNRQRRKHRGFAGIEQAAVHFGLSAEEVKDKAESGEWPSYVIAGHRVFDLDELVEGSAEQASPQGEPAHA